MANKPLPTPDVLRQLLRYEPETGRLIWRQRGLEWFRDSGRQSAWTKRFAGKEVRCVDTNGYLVVTVLGKKVSAHRAAWAIFHGQWPVGVIDHIDGCPTNNRMQNLRSVTHEQNARNAKLCSVNKSGVAGVWWCNTTLQWVAQIRAGRGKRKALGRFRCLTAAMIARKLAEARLGYHANHGRKA